jgi:hypothetical protein
MRRGPGRVDDSFGGRAERCATENCGAAHKSIAVNDLHVPEPVGVGVFWLTLGIRMKRG